MKNLWMVFLVLLNGTEAGCQDPQPAQKETIAIIDSHVHVSPKDESMQRALQILQRNHVVKFCTKSASFVGTTRFKETLQWSQKLKGAMAFFVNLDWRGIDEPTWGEREAQRLAEAVEAGARGVKIFKNLGLGVRTQNGKLLEIDDASLDPIMQKAAQIGAIVAIHTGDPKAFFEPPTPDNERYLELLFAPSWSFFGEDYPSRQALLQARNRLIERHPKTIFLGIHLANNPEDLDYVDSLLDRFPNLYVDVSARLGEIGRHAAEKVRSFFVKHQDRILFGTDLIVSSAGLQLGSLSILPDNDQDADLFYSAHREFFETDHKAIDHPTPIQGSWKVDAINLPQEVLKKFYHDNANCLIFGLSCK